MDPTNTTPAAAAGAQPQNLCIGDYVVKHAIAQGERGLVLEAAHKKTRLPYVIKLIPKTESQRYKQEIYILSQMQHKYVIGMECWMESEDFVYIVMEKAEGGDLMDKLSEVQRFSEIEVKPLYAQICQAVQYTHRKNIAHLDLKPENIFLDAAGNVKLGDFGSGFISQNGEPCKGDIIGTPYYCAPEVKRGPFDPFAADAWSLGIILYVLCTGSWPFDGSTYEEVKANAIRGAVTFHENFSLSRECSELIRSCVNLNPKERPTVDDLLKHPFLSGYVDNGEEDSGSSDFSDSEGEDFDESLCSPGFKNLLSSLGSCTISGSPN